MLKIYKLNLPVALSVFIAGRSCLAQMPPIFDVSDYGATGDGTDLDSPAINAAIAAAGAAGGGTVAFPPGNYLSASIHLTNNVTLYLSNNAVILAATNGFDAAEPNPYSQYQDYGHSHFHDSLIWGENLTNVGLAGSGSINGNGSLTSGNPSAGQADKALTLVLCDNVAISGITITAAGHFGILADGCTNMIVAGAQILNAYANQHRDGFNLVDCSDIVITNCLIQGSDDAMVLKSDYALGRKIGGHDIHIMDCRILSTENNATQFGSETVGDFTDVSWSNLQLGAAGKAGIGITSQDGSVIDGVTYDNIIMSNCACPIFLKLDYRTTYTPNPSVGGIRNINFNNVTAVNSAFYNRTNTSTINGYFDGTNTAIPIENVIFNNVNVSNPGGNPASAITNYPVENQNWQPQHFGQWPSCGWYIRYARNISFTKCQVHFQNNDDRPAVVADTATNILFDGFSADVGQNNTNCDLGFLNVYFDATDVVASANAPTPGAALRIYASNATPAQIALPPYFSPGDGIYATTQSVVIASVTTGAKIRYTTDGTTPSSTNGLVYSGPVAIGSETVLRAMAYAGGMVNSAVATAIYNFPGTFLNLPPPPPMTDFLFEAVALASITNGAVAVVQTDSNEPGGEWLALEATGVGQYIQYAIPEIPAGTYDLQMLYKPHYDRGVLSFALDGTALGTLDQYLPSSAAQTYPTQDWGEVMFATNGAHTIRLTVVGKNAAASGYGLSAAEFVFSLVQPPPPVLGGALTLSNGVVQLSASGYPTLPYRVQASTNLFSPNWLTVGAATANASGALLFTDTNAASLPAQFYRLVTP